MYFKHCETLEDLKREYHRLAKQHHPDLNHDANPAVMKAINAEYDTAFARLKNTYKTTTGETYTAKEDTAETPDTFRDIISRLITLEGITIEICGTWLWITGNTYQYRDTIKVLGFRWAQRKAAWYYYEGKYTRHNKKHFTLDEIRDMHGSTVIDNAPTPKLNAV